MLSIFVLSSVLLLSSVVKGGTADMGCINACADYSIALGWCRGQFEFNPHQTNVTYATHFVQCVCVGTGEGGVLGQEKMLDSVNICGGCATTPELIRGDLAKLVQLCELVSGSEPVQEVMSYAPYGYSVLTWNENGKPNEQAPKQAVG